MRAAIFRDGEIIVDTLPEPVPGRGRCWSRRWPAASAAPTCTRQARPSHGRSRGIFPAASRWTPPATSCSDTNSAARSSITARGTPRKLKPGTLVCSLPALLTPAGTAGHRLFQRQCRRLCRAHAARGALLLEVPNGLAAEHAALTEPLAVGLHAVAEGHVRGDEVPLVIGCGPVGLAVIAGLKIKGVHPIIAADYSPARRALAQRLGADIVVDPARDPAVRDLGRHAAMSPEQKAARPPLQALLPALQACADLRMRRHSRPDPAGVRRRAARRPRRRGRRLHGNRPLRAVARHRQGTQRPVSCWAIRRKNSPIACA